VIPFIGVLIEFEYQDNYSNWLHLSKGYVH